MVHESPETAVTRTISAFAAVGVTAVGHIVALNGTAVVYHPDANILLTTQWTQWQIPLQDFAAQGLKLTQINSLALGVGTKGDTSKVGGSGKMYFDDIRLYRPAPAAGQ